MPPPRSFWLATIVLAGAVVLGLRPWADRRLTAAISITTDDQGRVARDTISRVYRGEDCPLTHEIDLRSWAGDLARIDVESGVTSRWTQGRIGEAACSLELVTDGSTRPLPFASWRSRAGRDRRLGSLGPSIHSISNGSDVLAWSGDGPLWHVLRVPPGAKLRVRLRPVSAPGFSESRPGPPRPPGAPKPLSVHFRPTTRPPDVFIYLIDALRPDHLGCYGYARPTSPNIDAFARDSVPFEDAQTVASWTGPVVASLLTGLWPRVHGVLSILQALPRWPVFVPEVLHDAGYKTFAASANGNIKSDVGFGRGFDRFVFRNGASAEWIGARAAEFVRSLPPGKPCFAYIHVVETHSPYVPRPESLRRFSRGSEGGRDGSVGALRAAESTWPALASRDVGRLTDFYDARVWKADRAFGDWLRVLRKEGRYHNALIILLADHGEAFGEHATLQHGNGLNVEEMHVPLVIHFPGGRNTGQRVAAPVSLIDVAPSLLKELGLTVDSGYELPGRDLEHAATGSESHPVFAYERMLRPTAQGAELAAVIDEDGYKRIVDLSGRPDSAAHPAQLGLWHTSEDPREHQNLLKQMPVRAAYDEQLIAQWLSAQDAGQSSRGPAPSIPLSEKARDELRALGYVK